MISKLNMAIVKCLGLSAVALALSPQSHSLQPVHASCVACGSSGQCVFQPQGGGQCVEWEDGSCETTMTC